MTAFFCVKNTNKLNFYYQKGKNTKKIVTLKPIRLILLFFLP